MDISVSKECIAQAKEKMNKAIAHLEDELRNFKAGKANPAVFNSSSPRSAQTCPAEIKLLILKTAAAVRRSVESSEKPRLRAMASALRNPIPATSSARR